jgi:tetratricopeptide (TPR) repeat protein
MPVARDLLERRVPQVLAIYAGAGWGIVQFISFIEDRYGLSPHWTDITLLGLALLLPGVILFTYTHGRPGRDAWTRAEKIGIPLNVLGALLVLTAVFASKDLGAVTAAVQLKDESGQTVERAVPKASYRKRILLYNLDGPGQDTAVAWLRYGLPVAVITDLAQNMFLDVNPVALFQEKLRQQGFRENVNLPLAMKQSLAEQQDLPYFTDGTVTRIGDQISVALALHQTASGTVVRQRTFTGNNVFTLADEISVSLADDLGLPHSADMKDLPVAEFLTAEPAYRLFIEAVIAIQEGQQWLRGAELMEQAVALEPTFAAAQMQLHTVYLLTNQAARSMPPLQQAMDHLYRLPERLHYDVKTEYYMMKGEQAKALAVVKMKVDLFPEDIAGHQLLAQLYAMRNDKDGVIASYQKILELDPTRQELLRQMGAMYEAKGDFENALRYLTQYAERFPASRDAFISLADLYEVRGEHALARQSYEKALLIATGDVEATVGLARLDRDLGNFETAQRQFEEALAGAKTPEARSRALRGLAGYYEFRGQLDKALEYAAREVEETGRSQPALNVAIARINRVGTYVRAGQVEAARRIVQQVSKELQPPFNVAAVLGDVEMNVALERPDDAARALSSLEQLLPQSGLEVLRPRALLARGRIAELRDSCDQAIKSFEEALRNDPTDVGINTAIARCYRKLGQPQKGMERAQLTLQVMPFQGAANYEFALSCIDAGDRGRALEHLRRALQTWSAADPDYRLAAEARARLKQLEAGA